MIDYGSASKPVYRFARTYGFINFSPSDNNNEIGSKNSSSNRNSEAGSMREDSTTTKNGAASPTDALRVRVDCPAAPPNLQQLIVPIRLADVMEALTHEESPLAIPAPSQVGLVAPATAPATTAAATTATLGGRREGAVAPERVATEVEVVAQAEAEATTVAAAETAVGESEVKALRKRLRRYSTTLEEDLDTLRRRRTEAVPVVPPEVGQETGTANGRRETHNHHHRHDQNEEMEGSASAPPAPRIPARAAVTAEWVDMCVALRAAEKIALERALNERIPAVKT